MLSHTQVQEGSRNEPTWLQEKRKRAWDIVAAATPLPVFKYGLDIFTPLDGMNPTEPSGANHTMLSPVAGVDIQKSLPTTAFNLPLDRFAALHVAFATDVVHVRIPDNTVLDKPLVIQKIQSSPSFFHHLVVDVGKNSRAVILETLEGSGAYHSAGAELHIGDGANVIYGTSQHLSSSTHHFSLKHATLGRDASLEWVTADTGSALVLSRLHGTLAGQGSSLQNKFMAYGTGNQHFDFSATSVHAAPDTRSNIVQRAVLDGKAKMVFNGLVKIQANAPRSNGFQKEDTLMLSDDCQAAPIPALEIDNNDVRCSHGTTVGQIDKEQLFYLQSRGMNEEQAMRLIVTGFFDPLIRTLPLESMQENLRGIVQKRLEERA